MRTSFPPTALRLTALLLVSIARPQVAASQSPAELFVGGGAGFGWGTLEVDSDFGSRSGPVVVGQVGLSRSGLRTWSVEVEVQPFRVPSPVRDERFRAWRALVRRSFGSPFFVAPGVGLEYRGWSGNERVEGFDTGLVVAVGAGRYVRLDDAIVLLPAISWSYSPVDRGASASGAGVSLRVSVLRMRR